MQARATCAAIWARSTCSGPYAAVQPSNYVFQPPNYAGAGYGYGIGIARGYPFLLIGEHYRNVGNTAVAGQVYVYKKN